MQKERWYGEKAKQIAHVLCRLQKKNGKKNLAMILLISVGDTCTVGGVLPILICRYYRGKKFLATVRAFVKRTESYCKSNCVAIEFRWCTSPAEIRE